MSSASFTAHRCCRPVLSLVTARRSAVLRLPGAGTEAYIDRVAEARNAEVAARAGVSPELLYFDAATGVMLTAHMPSVTMNARRFRNLGAVERAGQALARLHRCGLEFAGRFDLFAKMDEYQALLERLEALVPYGFAGAKAAAEAVRPRLADAPLAPCHCDPLAENLIDYADPDDTRISGGLEDDYYQQQVPPYRAANGPLLSVDQLRLVQGFDNALVEIIRPYVTVYPYVGGAGVNPNTAPSHVLALIFYNDGVDLRLAKQEDVGRILEVRANGDLLCNSAGATDQTCVPVSEILPNSDSIFPPLALSSDTFIVRSEATAGDVRRTVEAVVDRSTLTAPTLLSWRVW